jgi:hypothetical protein
VDPESITTKQAALKQRRNIESAVIMDSGLAAEFIIGPREARTRWRRPGMTAS